MTEVIIYTDGACSGNPGPGGWAAILRVGDHEKEISGFDPDTTNQRMELTAAAQALQTLKYPCGVRLHSDSAYLVNAFRQDWLGRWEKNGWINVKKEPVENQDLWQQLLRLSRVHRIEWNKVGGHAEDELNNRCDALARGEVKRGMAKNGGDAE